MRAIHWVSLSKFFPYIPFDMSICHWSQLLVWVVFDHLKDFTYGLRPKEELKPGEPPQHRICSDLALDKQKEYPLYIENSNSVQWQGYDNKWNTKEPPMHPEKFTVWCSLLDGTSSKGDDGHNVMVNEAGYLSTITRVFCTKWQICFWLTCDFIRAVQHRTLHPVVSTSWEMSSISN